MTPATDTPHRTESRFAAARAVAAVAGAFFLCLGLAGLTTGITAPDLDGPPILPGSGVLLFGMFSVSVVHSVVHLTVGVLGILAARRVNHARIFLVGAGGVIALLWFQAFAVDRRSSADVAPFTGADYWLHFGVAAAMIVLGLSLGAGRIRPRRDDPPLR